MRPGDSRDKKRQRQGLVYFLFKRQLPLESETTLFIFLNILDFYLTYWGLWHGIFAESNPVARWFLDGWGVMKGMLLYKLALVTFVCGIAQFIALTRPQTARNLLLITSFIVGCVVIYSLRLIWIHSGRIYADEEMAFELLRLIKGYSA